MTFRHLEVANVLDLANRAGLRAVEWGGDVHVPAGDARSARQTAQMSADAGVEIAAYGSYYHAGYDTPANFEPVLRTAIDLGAPRIRIWAGRRGSADSDASARTRVAIDLYRVAELAAEHGIEIGVEHHPKTLTDTLESALELYAATGHPGVRPYWQPRTGQGSTSSLVEVATLLPSLVTVHVFTWTRNGERRALADGAALWKPVIAALAGEHGQGPAQDKRYALLEFVQNDDPAAFLTDAATLCRWLAL
ncbi:sugar phosphate isomerase/epimerase family protein [Streptomyces sp. NPDC004752]